MIPSIVTDEQVSAGLMACNYALPRHVMRKVLESAHPENSAVIRDAALRRLHKDPFFRITAYGSDHEAFALPDYRNGNRTFQVELQNGAWRVWAQIVHKTRRQKRWLRVDRTNILTPAVAP